MINIYTLKFKPCLQDAFTLSSMHFVLTELRKQTHITIPIQFYFSSNSLFRLQSTDTLSLSHESTKSVSCYDTLSPDGR